MRIRMTLLLVATLITAVFVALNWPEFVRPTPVSLGVTIVEMPLPLLLLVALLLALLGGMGNAAWNDARHDRELGLHMRELQAQRNLADKAEASRFTELRHYLDLQAGEARQREAVTAEALQATLIKGQRDMQASVEMLANRLAAQMGTIDGHQREERLTRSQTTL
jgi:biopolymer transport protein ExbB/TolQ